MRNFSLFPIMAIALLVSLGPPAHAQDVQFERVWPSYRDAASFTRLGEYLGSAPDAINREALRTQPDSRDGFYWLVRTLSPSQLAGCTFKIELTRQGQAEPSVLTFPFSLKSGNHAVNLGITGTDWTDSAERPLAWQLSLLAPNGTTLASEQSFLWQRPTE
jgi:hypothetical protein